MLLGGVAMGAQIPAATDLSGKPFFITKTWNIGGEGNWDYLALDATAAQLYVAHGPVVQVVDLNAGSLAGAVPGMRDAHGIALDESGQFGYVTDGPANRLHIFDRRSLKIVASASTGPAPRAVVFDPATHLVFAICTQPVSGRTDHVRGGRAVIDPEVKSLITVVDGEKQAAVGQILLSGKLGFALADGKDEIYVSLVDRNQIAHFNAQTVATLLQRAATKSDVPQPPGELNWSLGPHAAPPVGSPLRTFPLGRECQDPRALAIDGDHQRLFTACGNGRMQVLNTGTGEVVATLTIGPGTDAIGYDASRGLIFTANGGGLGSVTVVRQTVTDSYAVVQELPTQQRARTLAVNPSNGEVYLVTNLEGFDLNRKGTGGGPNTLPVVQTTPVAGSFQVLVVGN